MSSNIQAMEGEIKFIDKLQFSEDLDLSQVDSSGLVEKKQLNLSFQDEKNK